ncbi:SDR family NAD(P)-dependent oxidoreductase [Muricauda sp. 334s03]|uniref:SDR family NAD(P)-dependent oxidoreductase n=1 Tax=Flagellimonas yonaguniensis TaxID=3031325 RepID=A0ABT5Y070_9FLAO|nr:SDR family NAD(P)-dependent oxidoreductase [[Muricauda] yonaguniensis]MDF0716838.1 SDR family NAD(P)-dependent oxidoreductase [[Muricauda] yonaguniensis]
MKLIGKTILITGGTSGIGLELGSTLLPKNKVILMGRNKNRLKALKAEGFEIIACDLASVGAIEKCVVQLEKEYPQLDVLFNNAGIQLNYSFMDDIVGHDKVVSEINTNFTGQVLLTKLLIPLMSNSDQALIVNTTSALGMVPKQDALIYSATKAAMRSFNFGLKKILNTTNIDVIELIPPVTATAMTEDRDEDKMSTTDLINSVLPQIETGKPMATTGKIRFFNVLGKLFPNMAYKLVNS